MIKKRIFSLIIIFWFFSLSFFYSCKKDYPQIPDVYVNIALDLNDPDFFALNSSGNGIQITGGVAGIIVFRKSMDEFKAYERACPNDPIKEIVHISERGTTALDSVCGSEFSLLFDGEVLSGPAPYALKQYTVSYNSGSGIVYINN